MTVIGALDRLRALLATDAGAQILGAISGHPIALGWATVELDRAAHELGAELGIPVERFEPAADTMTLGARCRVAGEALSTGLSLALLEPSSEGRLAATLARLGEGPAAVWLAVADLPVAVGALRVVGIGVLVERPGPFGHERLVLDGPIHGPHRLLVELAGTIRA